MLTMQELRLMELLDARQAELDELDRQVAAKQAKVDELRTELAAVTEAEADRLYQASELVTVEAREAQAAYDDFWHAR